MKVRPDRHFLTVICCVLLFFIFVVPGGAIDGLLRLWRRVVTARANPRWLDERRSLPRTKDSSTADLVPRQQ
jgi:hypothetical protein